MKCDGTLEDTPGILYLQYASAILSINVYYIRDTTHPYTGQV